MPKLKSMFFLVPALVAALLSLPLLCLAADDPAAEELKKKAQKAFVAGRYAEAAANLEIAGKHPDSEARRYAVQMLGTLYKDNLVDMKKAIRWNANSWKNTRFRTRPGSTERSLPLWRAAAGAGLPRTSPSSMSFCRSPFSPQGITRSSSPETGLTSRGRPPCSWGC